MVVAVAVVVAVVVATYISNNNIEVVLHRWNKRQREVFSFQFFFLRSAYLLFSMFKLEEESMKSDRRERKAKSWEKQKMKLKFVGLHLH